MPEHHTRQNNNAGSPRARHRPVRGGVAHVPVEAVIAMPGACWCGNPVGHDWPGKDEGEPHPRTMEGNGMAVTETTRLRPQDIAEFAKQIREILMEIVNDHGVKFRLINGGHIMLYPPDGQSRPFKVSAKRPVKDNERILRIEFMRQYGLGQPDQPEEIEQKEQAVEIPNLVEVEETEPTHEFEGHDVVEAARRAVDILSSALGVDSLEEEALQALDDNDRLTRQVASLTSEVERARERAAGAEREADALKDRLRRAEGLLDEQVIQTQRAEARLRKLREAFADD